MKKLFFIIIILQVQFGFTQREANVWHFGAGAGLNFNSCEPVVVFSEMSSSEGCTSIANSDGELQFYTEGTTIWNRNHQTMSNGSGLLGHRSATQSAMIIKRPGNFNEYYVFTVDEIGKSNGLMYTVIDMDGDGGLGVVTSKNTSLVAPIVEKIHATKHANGTDIWLSVHGFENNTFYSFLVTSTGINHTPISSSVGPQISGDDVATIGAMKFSPNGKKLAICNYENGIDLLDFDNNTGLFGNLVNVTSNLHNYGVEFSSSNNILYVTTAYLDVDNRLLQFNLNAPDIQASETILLDLADSGGFGSVQLGPDQKVYVSIIGRKSLSVINDPNTLGVTCDFIENGISLMGATAKGGLPLFLFPIFHNKMIVEDTCFGDATSFFLSEDIETITWDFGDPASGVNNIATDNEPEHIFSAPGIYTVTTDIPAGCGTTQTITKEIEIFNPQTSTSVQLVQCDDDSDGYSYFNLNEANSILSPNSDNQVFGFYRTEDDAIRRINNISETNSYENIIVNSDSVWASVGNDSGCYNVIEVNLIVSQSNVFDTFQTLEYTLCDDDINDGITTFDFSSAQNSIEALFPNQDIDIIYYGNLEDALAETNNISDITFYENTGYPYSQNIYVRVDDNLKNDCLGITTPILLTVLGRPQFDLDTTAEFCPFDTPSLTIEAYNPEDIYTYEWTDSNGAIISTQIDAIVNAGGIYTLIATSNTGCKSTPKEIEVTALEKTEITLDMITIEDGLNNNTITIDESRFGTIDYEYVLDNEFGFYQDNPFFQNVTAGTHTIYARGKNNCKPSSIEISVIGFPKFFTPNNDSFNETWNLKGISNEYASSSRVSIFDRFGRLIKQINPFGIGWNGTFNGEKSMQSDYWFIAELINTDGEIRILKGHFSLIR
ncbi:T9SS type B sorting domain-containing protein [Seonamhaeicola maritimus]|uniref:T9SS type B sorting domain-containing protein n=1 Tax=Seonamhaeicola maritimus TaxID=2591822 RepID=UPI0024954138|nr:T9SS type B sorting domain-containing protein [Seonamhaeicola maritimus]